MRNLVAPSSHLEPLLREASQCLNAPRPASQDTEPREETSRIYLAQTGLHFQRSKGGDQALEK